MLKFAANFLLFLGQFRLDDQDLTLYMGFPMQAKQVVGLHVKQISLHDSRLAWAYLAAKHANKCVLCKILKILHKLSWVGEWMDG